MKHLILNPICPPSMRHPDLPPKQETTSVTVAQWILPGSGSPEPIDYEDGEYFTKDGVSHVYLEGLDYFTAKDFADQHFQRSQTIEVTLESGEKERITGRLRANDMDEPHSLWLTEQK